MSMSLPPVPVYLTASQNESAQVAKFQSYDPSTKASVAYFQQQAPSLTTPGALLKDYRSLQLVLGAFSMGSYISDTALLRQLMTQDPSDKSSLAARSANPLFQRFAQFMSNWNPPPLSNAQTVGTITRQFATNNYEQAQGRQSPGVQQALYFRRSIGSVTSAQQIIADPTLLQVVTTGYGLPQQFGLLDYNQQVSILTRTVDFSKLKSQDDIDRFAEKFLLMNQMNAITGAGTVTSTGSSADPLLTLFGAPGSTGADPILSLFGNTGSQPGSLLSTLV